MNDKPDFIKEAMSKNNIELKVWSVLMVLVFLFPPHSRFWRPSSEYTFRGFDFIFDLSGRLEIGIWAIEFVAVTLICFGWYKFREKDAD
ncbi:MAG TPA: hypothetical protein QF517_10925 [Pseudomonadales bacterium]|nr:hypothetical protein [Pseudomonadales bacterium]